LSAVVDRAVVLNALASRGLVPDASQQAAITALVGLLAADHAMHGSTRQGVYCHGLPGRGKSLVVDTVFEWATCAKRRLHFHEFLREMNRQLVNAPPADDRLGSVAQQWLDGLEGAHDLSRTLSRLAEMRSASYRNALDRLLDGCKRRRNLRLTCSLAT
jgi:predicted ATPase